MTLSEAFLHQPDSERALRDKGDKSVHFEADHQKSNKDNTDSNDD